MELKNKNIVAIVAHPDDETIGCGGLLQKAAACGANCHVVLPTRRIDRRGIENWNTLIRQFHQACSTLGAKAVVAEELVEDLYAELHIPKIADQIHEHIQWADLVLTHWQGDMHQAHQALSRAVELCTRPFRTHKDVWCFEVPTATDQAYRYNFSPNCFVALSEEQAAKKKQAMLYYDTEQIAGREAENLVHHLRHRGNQIGKNYAEAFMIMRHFIL